MVGDNMKNRSELREIIMKVIYQVSIFEDTKHICHRQGEYSHDTDDKSGRDYACRTADQPRAYR